MLLSASMFIFIFPQDALKTPKMKSFMNSLDISTQDVPKLHQRFGGVLVEIQIPSMPSKMHYMCGNFEKKLMV